MKKEKDEFYHMYVAIRFNDLIVARNLSKKMESCEIKNECRNYLIVVHITSNESFENFEEQYKVIQQLALDNYPSIILFTINMDSNNDMPIPKKIVNDFEEFHKDLINSKIKKTDSFLSVYLSNYYI